MQIDMMYQLDPAVECIRFLTLNHAYRDGTTHGVAETCHSLANQYSIPLPELEAMTAPLAAMEEALSEVLMPRREVWEEMFYDHSEEENTLAWSFFTMEHQGDVEAIPLPELRRRLITETLTLEPGRMDAVKDLDDLMTVLDAVCCTERTKWVCMQLWRSPLAYYRKYRDMVSLAEPVVRRFEPELATAIADAVTHAEKIARGDPNFAWNELEMDRVSESMVIVPMGLDFNGLGVCWDDTAEDSQAFQFVGIFKDQIQERIRTAGNRLELLSEQLKTISDPRRLEILNCLKHGTLCGQDLVARLKVSPGTVSHHMSSLVRDGFVTVSKSGTKIFYSLQRERTDAFFQQLRDALLEP